MTPPDTAARRRKTPVLLCYECVLSQKPTDDNRIVIQEGYSLCVTHMAQGVRRRLP